MQIILDVTHAEPVAARARGAKKGASVDVDAPAHISPVQGAIACVRIEPKPQNPVASSPAQQIHSKRMRPAQRQEGAKAARSTAAHISATVTTALKPGSENAADGTPRKQEHKQVNGGTCQPAAMVSPAVAQISHRVLEGARPDAEINSRAAIEEVASTKRLKQERASAAAEARLDADETFADQPGHRKKVKRRHSDIAGAFVNERSASSISQCGPQRKLQ